MGSLVLCSIIVVVFFFFKQKTAYEIVSRDWSSDVCSSDLSSYVVQMLQNLPSVGPDFTFIISDTLKCQEQENWNCLQLLGSYCFLQVL